MILIQVKLVNDGTVRGWSNLYSRYFFKNSDTTVDFATFFATFDKAFARLQQKLSGDQ